MKLHVYKLECLSNMHVGDGDVNYNIIDNQVQRDVVLEVPTIHSSGVKGALRSYAQEENRLNAADIKEVFGGSNGETSKGEYKFFAGNMLARPLRVSKGESSYVLATSNEIIENEVDFLMSLGAVKEELTEKLNIQPKTIYASAACGAGVQVEGSETVKFDSALINMLLGDRWVLMDHNTYKEFDFPVQARNCLDDGKSKNLWYEEIVPHKSIFYISIVTPTDENKLDQIIKDQIVQFGADASIGYGFCKISKLDL